MTDITYQDLFNQADNLRNNAQVDEAIRAYQQIAAIAGKNNDIAEVARANHMAGVSAKESITEENKYFRDAIEFFKNAEVFYKQLSDRLGLGNLYRDCAIALDHVKRYDEADRWFNQSIEQLKAANNDASLGVTYDKYGLHYLYIGQIDQAKRMMNSGLSLLEKDPNAGFFTATTLYDLARANTKETDYAAAKDLAEESLSWFLADHGSQTYNRRIAELKGLLSAIYLKLGDEKRAKQMAEDFEELLKKFDVLARESIEQELDKLLAAPSA